jgi:hypothetical protein
MQFYLSFFILKVESIFIFWLFYHKHPDFVVVHPLWRISHVPLREKKNSNFVAYSFKFSSYLFDVLILAVVGRNEFFI